MQTFNSYNDLAASSGNAVYNGSFAQCDPVANVRTADTANKADCSTNNSLVFDLKKYVAPYMDFMRRPPRGYDDMNDETVTWYSKVRRDLEKALDAERRKIREQLMPYSISSKRINIPKGTELPVALESSIDEYNYVLDAVESAPDFHGAVRVGKPLLDIMEDLDGNYRHEDGRLTGPVNPITQVKVWG